MNPTRRVIALLVLLMVLYIPAEAQQPPKVSRVGFLAVLPAQAIATRVNALRQGLREIGYVEARTLR